MGTTPGAERRRGIALAPRIVVFGDPIHGDDMNQHPPSPPGAYGASHYHQGHGYQQAPPQAYGHAPAPGQAAPQHYPAHHQPAYPQPTPGHGAAPGNQSALRSLLPHEQVVAFIPHSDTGDMVARWIVGFAVTLGGAAFLIAIRAKAKGLVALPVILGALIMRSAITSNKRSPLGLLITSLRVMMVGPKGETLYEYDLRQVADLDMNGRSPSNLAKTDPKYWKRAKKIALIGHGGQRQLLPKILKQDAPKVGLAVAQVLQGQTSEPLGLERATERILAKKKAGSTRGWLLILATVLTPILLVVSAMSYMAHATESKKQSRADRAAEARALAEAAEQQKEDMAGDALWMYRRGKSEGFEADFKHWGKEVKNPFGVGHKAYLFHNTDARDTRYDGVSAHELDFGRMKPAPKTGIVYEPILGPKGVVLIQSNPRMSELKSIFTPMTVDRTHNGSAISKALKEKGWKRERGRTEKMKVGDTTFDMSVDVIVHTETSTKVEYVAIPFFVEFVRGKKVYMFAEEDAHIQVDDDVDLARVLEMRRP